MQAVKMTNNFYKILILIIIFMCICTCNMVNAATTNTLNENTSRSNHTNVSSKAEVEETLKNLVLTIKSEGMNKELLAQTINLYSASAEKYSNEEIATMIESCKAELTKEGISTSDIDSVTKVLRNIDATQLKKVLNTINIDEISAKIENGDSFQSILDGITSNMSTTQKINLFFNLLLSAYIIKGIMIAIIVLFIYRTLLRCVIYKKAGKRAWAPFIPIYRNVVMLKICGMSPWWLLLLLVPVIGWAFLWVVSVASKFMLAEAFGKKPGFAFGLWLLAPVFETIIVCSWKTKYVGFCDNEEESF